MQAKWLIRKKNFAKEIINKKIIVAKEIINKKIIVSKEIILKNNCCKRNNWLENNCCSQPWISSTLAGTLQSIVSIPQTQTTFNFIFILIQLTRSFQFARFQLICSSAPSSTAPRLTPAWTRSHPGSWQTNTFFSFW